MKTVRSKNEPAAVPTSERSWVLLVGISVASTLGLAAAVLPVLEQRVDSPWPWAHTQRFLLLAFPVTIAVAVAHLSHQQRRAAAARQAFMRAREREIERARRQSARLKALLNVSHIMGTEVQLQGVFDAVTRIAREAFACDQVSLMLVEKDSRELVVRSASGHAEPEKIIGSRQKIGEGVAGMVAHRGEAVVLGAGAPDASQYPGMRRSAADLAAAIVVPILVRDELVGVVSVASQKPGTIFDEDDLQALQVFASNVGSCIRHAEQAEWMRQLIHRTQAAAAASRETRPAAQPSR